MGVEKYAEHDFSVISISSNNNNYTQEIQERKCKLRQLISQECSIHIL